MGAQIIVGDEMFAEHHKIIGYVSASKTVV